MLLTITTTTPPATDLGYLLGKHPDRAQSFDLGHGQAHVLYPQADPDRCTAALWLDLDPFALPKPAQHPSAATVRPPTHDRPYVASSLLSTALARVFGSALSGRCRQRPDLVHTPLDLTLHLSAVPSPDGAPALQALFTPLGYTVQTQPLALPFGPDTADTGATTHTHHALTLRGQHTLRDALAHLYVLAPVLDDAKHYWIGPDEVDKLLRHGRDWLPNHPLKNAIADAYLKRVPRLARAAVAHLRDVPDPAAPDPQAPAVSPHTQRLDALAQRLKQARVTSVLDLGCGDGRLLQRLLRDPAFTRVVGLDASTRRLERARDRLRPDRMDPQRRQRLALLHGSVLYRDDRLSGFDAVVAADLIGALHRLDPFERTVFEHVRPSLALITTPNADHRAKHTPHAPPRPTAFGRDAFDAWARAAAARFGYRVTLQGIGPTDPEAGAPTLLGVFQR